MKNFTKEKFLELFRKTDFLDSTTYTCINEAYQDFIFKLREVTDFYITLVIQKLWFED